MHSLWQFVKNAFWHNGTFKPELAYFKPSYYVQLSNRSTKSWSLQFWEHDRKKALETVQTTLVTHFMHAIT